MNAIGLGADMVAFIVLASQLSKVLYTTFSSIKDGPSNARRVSSHLLQLHEVLEQLRHYPLARHDTELTRHVESCIADLESLFNSAQKFQSAEVGRKTDRMWKRLKSFLGESKIECINEQIVAHINILNFRLVSEVMSPI
ncbi:hypothetical protein F4801DRAFT_558205 [Xylaria longipes]|nr:hypothetical protein F4801DRAFT_558205 [Xylaria longipes]